MRRGKGRWREGGKGKERQGKGKREEEKNEKERKEVFLKEMSIFLNNANFSGRVTNLIPEVSARDKFSQKNVSFYL